LHFGRVRNSLGELRRSCHVVQLEFGDSAVCKLERKGGFPDLGKRVESAGNFC